MTLSDLSDPALSTSVLPAGADAREVVARGSLLAVAHGSVSAVDPTAWDALAGGRVYGGHRWTTYQERDARTLSWVVTVVDGDDLVAAASLHLVVDEQNAGYDVGSLLGCDQPPRSVLLCGNRRGYDNPVLVAPGRDDALTLLIEALRAESARVGADAAFWPYLDDEGVAALLPTAPATEPWLLQVTAQFDLPGETFEDFVAAAGRRQRADIRRDRRRFAEATRTLRTARPQPDDLPTVAELVTRVETKHGGTADASTIEQLLRHQIDDVGDDAVLVSCADDEGTIACSLSYRGAQELAVRVAGLDHDRAGEAGEYFETVYYRPIELAYELGVDRVSVGFGSLRTKRLRGATLTPRWGLPLTDLTTIGPRDPAVHNEATIADLEAEERISRESCVSELLHDLVSAVVD